MFRKVEIITNNNLGKLKNFLTNENFPFLIYDYYQKEEDSEFEDIFEDYQLAMNDNEREIEASDLEDSEDEEDIVNEEW